MLGVRPIEHEVPAGPKHGASRRLYCEAEEWTPDTRPFLLTTSMPYLFTCPHCSAKTQVEDRYSGQSGECFTCGGAIEIPDFTGAAKHSATDMPLRPAARSMGKLIAAGVVLLLLVSLVFVIVQFGGSSVTRLAEVRKQRASLSNLETIAAAMNAYAADYGVYPPPMIRNAAGMPMHSWRVLLLPYLGEQTMYDGFDLGKPWNHPTNIDAAYMMPEVYLHPADDSTIIGRAGYYMVTGKGTLFPPQGPLGPEDVTDKPAQTILLIAGAAPSNRAGGGWTEPLDYDFAKMRGVINGNLGVEPGGMIKSGVTVVTVDGRGHFLPNEMPPATFNALVTPRGNEPLADDTLD